MPVIQPIARLGLAKVLITRSPHLTADQAVRNATDIITALHRLGLQVGPTAAFGPQKAGLDALDLMAELVEEG
jgi:hypothetical protein